MTRQTLHLYCTRLFKIVPLRHLILALLFSFASSTLAATDPATFDLVVYGHTNAGVMAGVQAKRMERTLISQPDFDPADL